MNAANAEPAFHFWGPDRITHGPMSLVALTDCVQSKQLTADTWIFSESANSWTRASKMPELNFYFGSHQHAAPEVLARAREMGVNPEGLRHIKILAHLDAAQLERFIDYIELVPAPAGGVVVQRGSHGDAMYLLQEGEVRVRVLVDNKETVLTTLRAGDFFGEISLLDQGPRSADVVANEESLLLRITASLFERMKQEAPDVALPFLFNVSRSVVTRMRTLTRRYTNSVQLWQVLEHG